METATTAATAISAIVALGLLTALVKKVIDAAKYLTNRQWNGFVTQVIVWGAGFVAAFVGANAEITKDVGLPIGDAVITLGGLDIWSLILLGLSIGSLASVGNGAEAAIDINRDTTKPRLFPSRN